MTRNVFSELMEGFTDLDAQRQGKKTLRTHTAKLRALPEVSPAEILKIREHFGMSRAVFADRLRMNPRTVEGWEQGRVRPNAQATALIRLVQKFPETMEHLAALEG